MPTFHYVYILISERDRDRHYVGMTTDLRERLNRHNSGRCSHTTDRRPWRIETAIAFRTRDKALAFERYLETHFGRAFANRHS